GKVAREGADLLVPRFARAVGSEEPTAGALEPVQRAGRAGREHSRVSAVELDRAGRLALHPFRKYSGGAAVLCAGPFGAGAGGNAGLAGTAVRADAAGGEAEDGAVPDA